MMISEIHPVCKWEVETSLHAVWSCKSLRGVRQSWICSDRIGNGKVAILKGLQLAFDTGLVPLDLVSDTDVVVRMVNDRRDHAAEIGLVIEAIRRLMLYLPSCVLLELIWLLIT
ncbi:hypothetical protein QYF36_011352 [Acer negundo]|nr:hypothetical protein QYF36_011352 [Acer negundo]